MQRGPAERRIVRLRLQSGPTTTFGPVATGNTTTTIMKDKDPLMSLDTSTDSTGSITATNKIPTAIVPAKMKCTECSSEKVSQEMWWCRTCLKTICIQCNLLKGHTEHRSSPWTLQEIGQSLINAVELRRMSRDQRAVDEEIAIKEYMVEVENYFLNKLNKLLQDRNEDDRRLTTNLCHSLKYDPKLALPNDSSPITQPILALHGLEDNKLERILQEIKKLNNVEFAFMTTNASSRPQTPTNSYNNNKRRSFGVLPDMTTEDFAKMLEDKLADEGWNRRARANSVDLVLRSGTPIELVYETNPSSMSQSRTSPLPVEPKVTVVNGSTFNRMINGHNNTVTDAKRSSEPREQLAPKNRAYPESFDSIDGPHNAAQPTSSVQLMVSEDTQTGGSVLTSATQTDIVAAAASELTPNLNGNAYSTSPTVQAVDGPPAAVSPNVVGATASATVAADRASLPGDNMSSVSTSASEKYNVTAFYFGHDFLTRPIDICILPDPLNRLAVSDSCGGVYITSRDGDVINQIWTEGGSASSLCFSPSRKELLVSVMKKQGRTIQIYNGTNYELIESIPCPTDPDVELTRSRWLATSHRGEIYIVSGDNRVSALWKYNRSSKSWLTLKFAKGTRYQYLTFIDEQPADHSVTLLTCEGVQGALIVFHIRSNRIVAEQAFNKMYNLNTYIRSPASAVQDEAGNLLILDYANGKLWLLSSSKNGKDRHLKVLMEVGGQEGMGLAANDGWCYVACLNKKRIHAMKYCDM